MNNIMNNIKREAKKFWNDEDVLVGLVVLFKKQITDLVNSVLSKMTNQANKI